MNKLILALVMGMYGFSAFCAPRIAPHQAMLMLRQGVGNTVHREKVLRVYGAEALEKAEAIPLTFHFPQSQETFEREELYVAYSLADLIPGLEGNLVIRYHFEDQEPVDRVLKLSSFQIDKSRDPMVISLKVWGRGTVRAEFFHSDVFKFDAAPVDAQPRGPQIRPLVTVDPIEGVGWQFHKGSPGWEVGRFFLSPYFLNKAEEVALSAQAWGIMARALGAETNLYLWDLSKLASLDGALDEFEKKARVCVNAARIEAGQAPHEGRDEFRGMVFLRGPERQPPSLSRFVQIKSAAGESGWAWAYLDVKKDRRPLP